MKLILLLFFMTVSSFVVAESRLLLVGGGKRPVEAMQEFSKIAGSDKAYILVIPWASETTDGAEAIQSELISLGSAEVEVLGQKISVMEAEAKIKKATGIFFGGGDQNKLMEKIHQLNLDSLLKMKYLNGTIFGGTSAGTAIMSQIMLTGESDLTVIDASKTEVTKGLGLLPSHIIVDQHFIMRSRFNRLAGLVLKYNGSVGIGIDESTALMVLDNKQAVVMGPTKVIFMQSKSTKSMEVKILSAPDTYEF